MTIQEIKKKINSEYIDDILMYFENNGNGISIEQGCILICKEEYVGELYDCNTKELSTVFLTQEPETIPTIKHNLNVLEEKFGLPKTKIYNWRLKKSTEWDDDEIGFSENFTCFYPKSSFWFKNYITLDLLIILVRDLTGQKCSNFNKLIELLKNGKYFKQNIDNLLPCLDSIKELSKLPLESSSYFIMHNEGTGIVSSLDGGPLSFIKDLDKTGQKIKIVNVAKK